jgi:hypothetical protein
MGTGALLTLASQPAGYWHNPALAMRSDSLALHDPTNHAPEFFLAAGPLAYAACMAAATLAAYGLASVLPRIPALLFMLTVVLSWAYSGTNWVAVRWHAGMLAFPAYGLGLGIPLAFAVARPAAGRDVLRNLAWIAVATLLVDFGFTLLGQPASYWSRPETAYEGNVVSRFFLVHGWSAFLAYDAVYSYGLYRLVVALPAPTGRAVAWLLILSHFCGAANWLFFVWRLGLPAVAGYGLLLSGAIVLLVFGRRAGEPAPSASGRESRPLASGCF